MRRRAAFFIACVACDSSAPPDGGLDASLDVVMDVSDSSDSAMMEAQAACNDLSPKGSSTVITETPADAPPIDAGGAIANGNYALTSYVVYTGDGGASGNLGAVWITARIADAGTLDLLSIFGALPPETSSFAFAIEDAGVLALTPTCPGGPAQFLSYAATPSELLLRSVGAMTVDERLAPAP